MLNSLKNVKVISSIVCAVIMLVILVMMFVPYWNYIGVDDLGKETGEKTTSINGFVWFPNDNKGILPTLENKLAEEPDALVPLYNGLYFDSEMEMPEPLNANKVALPIGFQILFGAFGVLVCLWKPKATAGVLFPICCGLAGIFGYLFIPALRMSIGAHLWIINLALAVISLVAGIVRLVLGFKIKETVESLRQA